MTPGIVIIMVPMLGFGSRLTEGILLGFSSVNTLENCLLKSSDVKFPSLIILPSTLKSATPGSSFFYCLIYDQKRFGFSSIAVPKKSEIYVSLVDFKSFCSRFLAARNSFQCAGFPDFFALL